MNSQTGFWFPSMKIGEIVRALAEWGLPVSEDQIQRPNGDTVQAIYIHFIQQVMGINSETPDKVGQELIKAALQGGGEDNVSVIVIQISETDQQVSVSEFQLLAKPETVTMPALPSA